MIQLARIFSVTAIIVAVMFSARAAEEFKSTQYALSNGLTVVLVPNQKAPVVTQMLWYKIGAQDESEHKTGLAHFLEHLMFKATKNHPTGEFSKQISHMGGVSNAFTTDDVTVYFEHVAKENLEKIMALEADRMQKLTFNAEEINTERNVVLEERRMRVENDPIARLILRMRGSLFSVHPYRRPTIGFEDDIKNLSPEEIQHFYETWYAPNNAVLVIVGDIEEKTVKPMIEKYFGTIPAHSTPKHITLTEPPLEGMHNIVLKDAAVKSPKILRFYPAPSLITSNNNDAYALTVLSELLGGSSIGRLYQRLVLKDKKALSVEASYEDLSRGPSYLGIAVIPAEQTEEETIARIIDEETSALCKSAPTEKELKHIKETLIANTIYTREDPSTLGLIYGRAAALLGVNSDYVEKWTSRIQSVKANDIQRVACDVFSKNAHVTGIVMQEKQ